MPEAPQPPQTAPAPPAPPTGKRQDGPLPNQPPAPTLPAAAAKTNSELVRDRLVDKISGFCQRTVDNKEAIMIYVGVVVNSSNIYNNIFVPSLPEDTRSQEYLEVQNLWYEASCAGLRLATLFGADMNYNLKGVLQSIREFYEAQRTPTR